ncbi:c-type cytochrome [Robiginitalea sp. M366]|uniref:c-type cytochrome n=1 Tax=Robiginitalea aestuariiviva TaxID=3036903 RepID=UPI00240DCB91|nr:c-type cytochrome [Robiginitalea aestuariiviva]MDG1572926.1 c-type cytochrome [Robiginitalea aestuariiviva]
MDELRTLARKLGFLFATMFALITALFTGLLTYTPDSRVSLSSMDPIRKLEAWHPRDITQNATQAPSRVRKGYELVAHTADYLGPEAPDPEMRFTGNHMNCTSCHLKAGTQAGAASWVGVAARFPQFGGRSNRVGTLEDRINGCMERSMNGRKLPVDSEPMQAMVAYMEWLGEDLPEAEAAAYQGFPRLKIPEGAVDLQAGEAVYAKDCAVCHGAGGQGISKPDGGYIYPPLWGPDSFNDGAGMHRVLTAAQFIKGNMPYGLATRESPVLTDEEAFQVAGYINSFDRPHKTGTEADYPDRTLKPVSTPYGPWADDFSPQQHQYGPFPPIIAYYKEYYNLTKTK